ncbi:MAG: FAD-dependent thymidylate synthase [bacterium]|nr:FAD-dependent thymidylate synthase [bacterium]
MQALYSRSPASVVEHAEKVRQSGSGKFMERFYVGYGHASIADCGSTTLFIENISILADKAIQDWPLYSGQETSTRYVDMSKQNIIDPLGTPESKMIMDKWMNFYLSSLPAVEGYIKQKFPRKENEKESIYDKAAKARAFDTLRGFLPAGITTQLSWHTNLRQAWDKLALLRFWPLPEARTIAEKMHALLKQKYPHSFSHELVDDQEKYRAELNDKYAYYNVNFSSSFSYTTSLSADKIRIYDSIIQSRPEKTGLPNFLAELGQISFEFLLDFGSFRDIQRHRNGVCRMPLLTTQFGFNNWYLEQLPEALRMRANELINEQKRSIDQLVATPEIKQYYIALGFNMACKNTYSLPAAVYVAELRSGIPVHPSLRKIAHQMHNAIMEIYPNMLMHTDLRLDDWDVRRGTQDITQKQN